MRAYDSHTPLLPATHQPSLALEFAQTQEVGLEPVVAGCGWHPEQGSRWQHMLSPSAYLHLLANTEREVGGYEVAFALGQQLLPGHYGACSHALLQAASMRHALEILSRHASQFSPLLVPHFRVDSKMAVLHWTAACGLGTMRRFVVNMHMSAVVAMCHWRSGRKLPWTFCFNRTAPRVCAAYEVHLGTRLQFGCQVDAMLIDTKWLDERWMPVLTTTGGLGSRASEIAALQEIAPESLLGNLYRHLLANVQSLPTLEAMAELFDMSPSTLKRKLSQEGTHFQAELDQVRSHLALHLMYFHGYDSEAVAHYLGFYDTANFRRSFKRWTGLTPGIFRDGLMRLNALP